MDFGITFQTDPPAKRVVELTQRAEELGFTHAWTFDSHILWQEPYVVYTMMLAATSKIIVGPFVTNPATRDPTVTASLFATLNDTFGNRTICGIGRGDSSRRVLGKKPTTLAQTEEAIHVIKELAEGRAIETPAGEVSIPWVRDGALDVWMAAYGPKALALTGSKADGFILQLADPTILKWTVEQVRAAASDAGRDPASVKVCVAAPAYVGEDLDHAREQCRWFGGMVGNHVADLVKRYGEGGEIPTALTDYIRAREGYDYAHHGRAGNPDTVFVPDEIVDRFCVLGTVEDHLAKLRELEELGVDQFNVYLMHDAMDATLDAYGAEVIPAMSLVARLVAGVEHQVVAVRVAEEGHVAHARVEGVREELDALALEFLAGRLDVVDVERDVAVLLRRELPAHLVRLPDPEARVADPELVVGLRVLAQPERVDVERARALRVGRGDGDEVQGRDHGVLLWSMNVFASRLGARHSQASVISSSRSSVPIASRRTRIAG